MEEHAADAAGDQQQQEEQVGWQDTDSEGMVDGWQLEDLEEQGDGELEQPAAAQPPALQQLPQAAALLQQTLQQAQQAVQQAQQRRQLQPGTADVQAQQGPQQHGQTADEAEGDVAATAGPQHHMPMHRHMAALIHRRVQALLRQALHQADTADDAAALQGLLQQTTELAGEAAGAGAGAGRRRARSSGSSGSSGSASDSSGNSLQETEEAEEPAEGCTRFDPNVTASHQYLGDVDELEGGYGHLQEGTTARLPLLMLDGVVLFPGCQLPLLLSTAAEQHLLDRALAAPLPLTRLLAVLPGPRSWMHSLPRSVACTAEVRQMRRSHGEGEGPGPVAVLALGRQRAEVLQEALVARSQSSVLVRILSEGCQADVPQPMRGYASPIHPALTAPWDLRLLASRVRQLIQLVLMPVASFQGSPLELSYYVSHNLPLQPSTRQLLLTASSPAERLRLLLGLLERLEQLGCSECGAVLATTSDVLGMTSEGISGTFVNSHGYVHEMVSFRRVHRVQLEGQPETAHSWFPGYAWTIAYCSTCGQHLGWRFTAVQADLSPRVFWGLRRQVLMCSTRPAPRGQQQQQGGMVGGGLGPGGALVIQLGNMPVGPVGEPEG